MSIIRWSSKRKWTKDEPMYVYLSNQGMCLADYDSIMIDTDYMIEIFMLSLEQSGTGFTQEELEKVFNALRTRYKQ